MNNRILFILSLILFAGCGQSQLSPEKYIKYIEDPENGLIQTKEFGEYRITLLYTPPEYMAVKRGQSDTDSIGKFASDNKTSRNFILRLEAVPKQTEIQELEDQLVYFLDYYAENSINLLEGNVKYPCLMFLREETMGLAPYHNVLLSFNATEGIKDDMTIEINADGLGIGIMNFKFKKEDISDIPGIK